MTTEQNETIQVIVEALEDVVAAFGFKANDVLTNDMLRALAQARKALALADRIRPTWAVNEVAGLKSVSPAAVRYWCQHGWLEASRPGGGPWEIVGTRDELLAFRPPKSGPKKAEQEETE